jgi:hypothetical protein
MRVQIRYPSLTFFSFFGYILDLIAADWGDRLMSDEKAQLLRALDDSRAELWAILEDIDPAAEIYPGWNKRDFFAHLAGWEAWIFETFRNGAYVPYDHKRYTTVDDANAAFVAERQSLSLETAKLEAEINRFAIRQMLADAPADDYHRPFPFPWGEEDIAGFTTGAITHERDHAREILAMKQAGKYAVSR